MKSIQVTSLKAGMVFNKAVYIEGNNILVPPDIPVKQKDLDRLLNWGILEVFTEGEIVNSGTAQLILDQATVYNSKPAAELSFYAQALKNLDQIFVNIRKKVATEADKNVLDNISADIYKSLKEEDSLLIRKILSAGSEHKNITLSSINCAILSAIIGQAIIKPKQEIINVITAALLHDTGMLFIPDAILMKQDKLSVNDLKIIRQHTENSSHAVRQLGYTEEIVDIVVHHHEKWNGNGYPEKLKSKAIPLGSRIIAVADTYLALINSRPYRNYLIGYNAMKAILSDNGSHFDPEIIKIFLRSIGIYPIGSIVRLSDQSIGKVTDINSKAPLRPKILLLKNSKNEKLKEHRVINLLEKENLFITKAMDPGQLDYV